MIRNRFILFTAEPRTTLPKADHLEQPKPMALKIMIEIQDRSEFMITELGMDMIAYEDKYYRVIENLFKIHEFLKL